MTGISSTFGHTAASGRAVTPARLVLLSVGALRHVLAISAATIVLFAWWVLGDLGGYEYYATPLEVRGYHPSHPLLRPSGVAGQSFGLAGMALMLVPFFYLMAKRSPRLRAGANLKMWLEIHIFCGIVGPVLITFHTAFKFNGLVSVAYWLMVLVAVSGFVGRYLYIRIPRTIRGVEVGEAEIATKLDELREHLQWVTPPAVLESMESFERELLATMGERGVAGRLLRGSRWLRRTLQAYGEQLARQDVPEATVAKVVGLVAERAHLRLRLAQLNRAKRLFNAWHVFHLPLVYAMLVIVSAHVALVLYLGYVPFRW